MNMEQGFPHTYKHGTKFLITPIMDSAISGLALRPSLLLPVHHPMAETRETQAETEESGSEGPQAFFPLWEHTGDAENQAGTDKVRPRTRSRD
uniref:Uncharacterized protein n=1 Tax=Arundo donax TaxID=35708 RepID=A0A0A8ZZ22_ARUDO